MIEILNRERVFTLKGNDCISEIYVMFSQILNRLPWVLFIVHNLSVCTFRVHCKVGIILFNYRKGTLLLFGRVLLCPGEKGWRPFISFERDKGFV